MIVAIRTRIFLLLKQKSKNWGSWKIVPCTLGNQILHLSIKTTRCTIQIVTSCFFDTGCRPLRRVQRPLRLCTPSPELPKVLILVSAQALFLAPVPLKRSHLLQSFLNSWFWKMIAGNSRSSMMESLLGMQKIPGLIPGVPSQGFGNRRWARLLHCRWLNKMG